MALKLFIYCNELVVLYLAIDVDRYDGKEHFLLVINCNYFLLTYPEFYTYKTTGWAWHSCCIDHGKHNFWNRRTENIQLKIITYQSREQYP